MLDYPLPTTVVIRHTMSDFSWAQVDVVLARYEESDGSGWGGDLFYRGFLPQMNTSIYIFKDVDLGWVATYPDFDVGTLYPLGSFREGTVFVDPNSGLAGFHVVSFHWADNDYRLWLWSYALGGVIGACYGLTRTVVSVVYAPFRRVRTSFDGRPQETDLAG